MASRGAQRVVVVTGANRGIGYHLTAALLADGYRVAAIDIDGDNLRDLGEPQRDQFLSVETDVADTDDVETGISRVLDQWGHIDILVNNAAEATFAPFEEQSLADIRRQLEVNVLGYVRMIHAVLPRMREQGGGIIHNVGSATGSVGHPGLSGYAASKGAIKGVTASLRLELRDTDIACTLMVPPTTDTRMSAPLGYPAMLTADPEQVATRLASKIESTDPVITPDRTTSIGLYLINRFPSLWARLTDRYVEVEA